MSSVEDVAGCADAGADALGFIFAASPRRISLESGQAQALTRCAPPFVTTVGVFANDSPELVRAAIAQCRLDVLQFSGDEDPSFCGSFGKPTILAVRGRTLRPDECAAAHAVALLVDACLPDRYGGTGTVVEAETFARVRADHPGVTAVLAGGLTPENVASIVAKTRPDAVDVRSGVERAGRIDPDRVRAFVAAARSGLC